MLKYEDKSGHASFIDIMHKILPKSEHGTGNFYFHVGETIVTHSSPDTVTKYF